MRLPARYASQISTNCEYNKILGWKQGQVDQKYQHFKERLHVHHRGSDMTRRPVCPLYLPAQVLMRGCLGVESFQSLDDADSIVLCEVRIFVPHDAARCHKNFKAHPTVINCRANLMLVCNKDSFYRSLNYYPKQFASGFSDITFPLSI